VISFGAIRPNKRGSTALSEIPPAVVQAQPMLVLLAHKAAALTDDDSYCGTFRLSCLESMRQVLQSLAAITAAEN
jgi:hypothetical protein